MCACMPKIVCMCECKYLFLYEVCQPDVRGRRRRRSIIRSLYIYNGRREIAIRSRHRVGCGTQRARIRLSDRFRHCSHVTVFVIWRADDLHTLRWLAVFIRATWLIHGLRLFIHDSFTDCDFSYVIARSWSRLLTEREKFLYMLMDQEHGGFLASNFTTTRDNKQMYQGGRLRTISRTVDCIVG